MSAHALDAAGVAGDPASAIHSLDPRAKIAGFFGVTLVAVSTPIDAWFIWGACAALLLGVAAVARVPARAIWSRARVVLPLVVFVAAFVPFVRSGSTVASLGPLSVSDAGLETFAGVTAKATIGTLAAVLLSATTSFPAVLRGLESMRVPRLFVLIAAFMYRYAFVVAGEVRRMRVALSARGFRPRTLLGAGAIGRVAGALFLRAYTRGERVHLAMTARGYSGSMPAGAPLVLRRADVLFVGALACALIPLRIGAGL